MNEAQAELIDVDQLRLGMYIELEMGWMSHPFPKGSFKISSDKQIEIIRGLGLRRVRYVPAKSDPVSPVSSGLAPEATPSPGYAINAQNGQAHAEALRQRQLRADLLSVQQRDLIVCERRFGEAIRQYKQTLDLISARPQDARQQCVALVDSFIGEMLGEGESAIRLLSEGMGDKVSMHPVNVTIISLLLGKSMGLTPSDMADLGVAAFLHDMGKSVLPDRVRWLEDNFSSAEYKLYQEHVAQGVSLGKRMELTPGALQAIAQHHELIDGSGFPARLKGEQLSVPAKILALINRYENLCNPSRPASAMTPHEALSLIFAQLKTRFDGAVLSAFIRMMGVYPPGSVVQLTDERFAIVVSVNSSRPLKPRVFVHEPAVPKYDALILDLEKTADLGIRRSLKPTNLPRSALDYLSPRQRICYFFERAMDPLPDGEPA